ncbi:DUF4177 domain-containing protein [Paenibacillus provencensis]|uniref:DUF4177 domain-containing protein n=1 Tax=Paenibacillus provencensis TaxID=441151 RepID=A0ABW3PH15_9BACL|nr:DUF4177 domain-containing protein [Paenibacillus sp. MER 78]MCM3130961.1 DUF4177 domain-containing protein [Paenibacillus sp. MER 78]
MKKWQYKVEHVIGDDFGHEFEDMLNDLGNRGWELSNVITLYKSDSNTEFQLEKVELDENVLIFKKPVEE